MTTPTSPEDFDRRFAAIRYSNLAAAPELFTPDEVAAYLAAKATLGTDFGYPYADVLRTFPRAWWQASIADILRARPDTAGARNIIDALFKIDPEYFAAAPHELVGWYIGTLRLMRFLKAHRETASAGLRRMLADPSDRWRWQAAAYLGLLDENAEPLIAAAIHSATAAERQAAGWALDYFGYEFRDGKLHRLWPRASYQLAFPAEYPIDDLTKAAPLFTTDVTSTSPFHSFGGLIEGRNDKGQSIKLHHMLTLDPVPPELGLTVSRLVLVLALYYVRDDGSETYYVHHPDGTIEAFVRHVDWAPHKVYPAIRATRVQLVPSPDDREFQSWGENTSGPGLFVLGGFPVFVQSPTYPDCLRCKRAMTHLLALDSGLPLATSHAGHEFHWWGSGGVANAFWCDGCRVSAWMWACT